jgi:hypothetical protein
MHIEEGFARGLHIFGKDELPLIRFYFPMRLPMHSLLAAVIVQLPYESVRGDC